MIIDLTSEEAVKLCTYEDCSDVELVETEKEEPKQKAVEESYEHVSGDEDFVMGRDVGAVVLRDLPHIRSDCAAHKFSASPCIANAKHCSQCFCFVCDCKVSECKFWGTGAAANHHCNSDGGIQWLQLRKCARTGDVAAIQRAFTSKSKTKPMELVVLGDDGDSSSPSNDNLGGELSTGASSDYYGTSVLQPARDVHVTGAAKPGQGNASRGRQHAGPSGHSGSVRAQPPAHHKTHERAAAVDNLRAMASRALMGRKRGAPAPAAPAAKKPHTSSHMPAPPLTSAINVTLTKPAKPASRPSKPHSHSHAAVAPPPAGRQPSTLPSAPSPALPGIAIKTPALGKSTSTVQKPSMAYPLPPAPHPACTQPSTLSRAVPAQKQRLPPIVITALQQAACAPSAPVGAAASSKHAAVLPVPAHIHRAPSHHTHKPASLPACKSSKHSASSAAAGRPAAVGKAVPSAPKTA